MKAKLALLFLLSIHVSLVARASAVPLVAAAEKGDVDKVRQLLDGGAPINAQSSGGRTALLAAAAKGRLEVVRLLLARGANPKIITKHWRESALSVAINRRQFNPEMVDLLLKAGADPLSLDSLGRSAFSQAQDEANSTAPHIEEVRALLQAEVNRRQNVVPNATAGSVPRESVPVAAAEGRTAPILLTLDPAFSSVEKTEDYAVVIGIENYADIPAAKFAERDAASMKAFVRAMGIPERNIMTLTGSRATRTGLEKALEAWLPNNVSEKSRVIVYYSGHGAPDPKTKQAYLVPVDGDPQYLAQTGYPLERLYAQLGKLKAKQVLVALDSCFSGAGGRSVLAKGTRPLVGKVDAAPEVGSKIAVLAASDGDQISGSNEEAGYGLFTYNILQGLNGAAKDERGQVTLKSLYDYIKPKVQDQARRDNREQTPQLRGSSPESFLIIPAK